MKIAIIDIDGVLNYYPATFLNFIYACTKQRFVTLLDAKNTIPYKQYKELKSEYRKSKYKHAAKPRSGAKELLQYLHKHNYLIYIITSRELYKDKMLQDTILWLRRNKLIYDFIYESRKKDFTIFEKFKDIDVVIEDNVNNIKNIMKISKARCYNVVNEDNKDLQVDCNRVSNLFDIIKLLKQDRRRHNGKNQVL